METEAVGVTTHIEEKAIAGSLRAVMHGDIVFLPRLII